MKNLFFVLAASLFVAFTSCSSSNDQKEISPTSTEFISGGLARLIEVVNEPCHISFAEQDGTIPTQFINLQVKLRLTKQSPELQEVDARDIDFTRLLSVAIVNLVDENGNKVQDLEIKSEDLLKLKKLLQGEFGDEETITFEGEFHNSDEAPKWYEQTVAFTPYLTADIEVGEKEFSSYSSSSRIDGTHDFHGVVDKYPVTMQINVEGSIVKGSYYYDKKGPNAILTLLGSNNNGILDLNETDATGKPTGHFYGKYSDGVYKGQFVTSQGKKMPFVVTEGDMNYADIDMDTDLDFDTDYSDYGNDYDNDYGNDYDNDYSNDYDNDDDNDDFDSEDSDDDDDDYGKSSSSSEDWNAVLNSYEKYVNNYISLAKKASQGDMAALAEYTSLLNKAQDLSNKLQKAKGQMTSSQVARYNKISMKLAKAAKEIQQ